MPLTSTATASTAAGGITYGVAKDSLRMVVENGVGASDPRVMRRTNEATQELLCATDPRTDSTLIPVGCMATYLVVAESGGYLLLPKELENVYSWVVLPPDSAYGRRDTSQGYYELINPVTYVDPQLSHDNPLADYGLVPDPVDPTVLRRKMNYQTLSEGAEVLVTGKKRYLPITADDQYLIIQNIPALKLMIQAVEYRENNTIDDAMKYKAEAVKMLSDEAKNHFMDPAFLMQRKSDYESDLTAYAETTLGYIRARLVLEVPTLARIGRVEGARIINEAVREAIDHRNYLGRNERYTFITGTNQLTFTRAVNPQDVLSYTNFEVIRLLVLAQRTPPEGVQPPQTANPAREQAFALIERNLAAEVEAQRLSFYRGIPGYPDGTLGKLTSRIGVEIPGFLELGMNQVSDMILEAIREAVDHHNFLGRTERYSLEDGPNQITYTAPTGDFFEVMPFTNFEVLRLLVAAQRIPPAGAQPPQDSTPMRQQAFSLIERDMAQAAEASRTAAHLAALNTYPMGTKGWMVARIGLELKGALEYTVNRLAGAVERAEMRLMERGLWKGCIEEFVAPVVCGHIIMPQRVESILAADLCGNPIAVRSIFYKYLENGPGDGGCSCGGRLEDEGDIVLNNGFRRHKYRLNGSGPQVPATVSTSTTPADTGGDESGDTVTADSYLYIGTHFRMVALPNGGRVEVLNGFGEWVEQSTWSE